MHCQSTGKMFLDLALLPGKYQNVPIWKGKKKCTQLHLTQVTVVQENCPYIVIYYIVITLFQSWVWKLRKWSETLRRLKPFMKTSWKLHTLQNWLVIMICSYDISSYVQNHVFAVFHKSTLLPSYSSLSVKDCPEISWLSESKIWISSELLIWSEWNKLQWIQLQQFFNLIFSIHSIWRIKQSLAVA